MFLLDQLNTKASRSYSVYSDSHSIRSTRSNGSLSTWKAELGLGIGMEQSDRPRSDYSRERNSKLVKPSRSTRRMSDVWDSDDAVSFRSARARPAWLPEDSNFDEELPSRRYSSATMVTSSPPTSFSSPTLSNFSASTLNSPIGPRKLKKRKSASLLKREAETRIIILEAAIVDPIAEEEEGEEEGELSGDSTLSDDILPKKLGILIEEEEEAEIIEGDSMVTSPSVPSLYFEAEDNSILKTLETLEGVEENDEEEEPEVHTTPVFEMPTFFITPPTPSRTISQSSPRPTTFVEPEAQPRPATFAEVPPRPRPHTFHQIENHSTPISFPMLAHSSLPSELPSDAILSTPIRISSKSKPKLSLKKSLERLREITFSKSSKEKESVELDELENEAEDPQWLINIRRLSNPIQHPDSIGGGMQKRRSKLVSTPPPPPPKTTRVQASKSSPLLNFSFDDALRSTDTKVISLSSPFEQDYSDPYSSIPSGSYKAEKNQIWNATSSLGRKESLDQLPMTMKALFVSFPISEASRSIFKKKSLPAHLIKPTFLPRQYLTFGSVPCPQELLKEELLISVLSCSIDEKERAGLNPGIRYGYIPGRSISGRVLKVGGGVTRFKRGEVVFGLLDSRTGGGLGAMAVVHQDLIALAPAGINFNQISSLPLMVHAISIMENLCAALPKGSKILILANSDPTGLACLQLAYHFRSTRDLWIVITDSSRTGAYSTQDLEYSGASEIIIDDSPLEALKGLPTSSFDAIIDLVGSKEIYLDSRRVLHDGGRFISTRGDTNTLEEGSQSQWSSLKRNFRRSEKKSISYWLVDFDAATQPRDSLDRLRGLIETRALLVPQNGFEAIRFTASVSAFERTGIVVVSNTRG